jgi:hypothetical protein
MEYDATWLYSSAAYSGAEFVAITGRYPLTRANTITTERATVDNELGLLAGQRHVRQDDLAHQQSQINDFEGWDIIEDHWAEIASDESPTSDELTRDVVDGNENVRGLIDERRARSL